MPSKKERKKKQSTREDICKSYVRKGVNIQNISKNSQSLTTTAKKPTSFKKKYQAEELKYIFPKKTYDGL